MTKLISRGLLIVAGGALLSSERECLNSIEILEEGKFRLMGQRLKQARRSPAVFQQDQKIFIVGGCNGLKHLDDAEQVQIDSVSSSQLEVPHGFSCAAFCQLGDASYIFGGFDGNCLNQVIRIQNQTATSQKPLITPLKNSSAIAISDTDVLLFGGYDQNKTLDTIFLYRTTDGFQSLHSRLPYPIEGHTTVKHQNYVYIIGGFDGISVVSTIIRYNLNTKESEVLQTKLSIARENHVTALVEEDGHLFLLVIGGWNGYDALKSCEKFKIEDGYLETAECKLELNQPRNRPAACLIE